MHVFQHGIWRPFVRTMGAYLGSCFGLDLLLTSNVEEETSIQSLHDGSLPPTRGDEAEQKHAANNDLHPLTEGRSVLPTSGQDKQDHDLAEADSEYLPEGSLPPTLRGENEEDGMLRLTIGATYDGDFLLYLVHSLHVEVMHAWKQVLFTYMHAEIGGHGKAFMAHDDDVVIVHAKPGVDPKVKKKTSLLLCLIIHMPFHPGESSHDGCSLHHHHALNTLINESPSPSSHHHHEPSSSTFFFLVSLSTKCKNSHATYPFNTSPLQATLVILITTMHTSQTHCGGCAATNNLYGPHGFKDKDVDQATLRTIRLPFTPLRGSKRCQAGEIQMKLHEEKTKTKIDIKPKMKLKPTMIKMGLHYLYLNKDLLDLG